MKVGHWSVRGVLTHPTFPFPSKRYMNLIICACCKQSKPETEFAKCSAKKNGRQSYCRPCATSRRQMSPFKYNPKAERTAQIKYKYGLTLECFEALWTSQDGKCAICDQALSTTEKRGHAIDHNHETGKVRGLLCSGCNTGLGLMQDSESVLSSAIKYLKNNGTYDRSNQRSP